METAFVENKRTFKFPLLFSQFHLQFTQNANRFTHVEQGLKKKGFAYLLVCKALLLTPAIFRKIIQGRTDLEQQER